MTPLDELDRLSAKAQPRPWTFEVDRLHDSDVISSPEADVCRTFNTDSGTCRDTSFIVAIVNAWPQLSAELKAARAVCEKADEYVGFAHLPGELEIAESCAQLFNALATWRTLTETPDANG